MESKLEKVTFKELAKLNKEMEEYMSFAGLVEPAISALTNFQDVFRKKIGILEIKEHEPGFMDSEVPNSVIKAFIPIYDMYLSALEISEASASEAITYKLSA